MPYAVAMNMFYAGLGIARGPGRQGPGKNGSAKTGSRRKNSGVNYFNGGL